MSTSTTSALRPGTLLSPGVSGLSAQPAAPSSRNTVTEPGFPTQALAPGELCRLPDAHRLNLSVLQGRLWLTQRNDLQDHFLTAGQPLTLIKVRDLLIENDGAEVAIFRWEAC
jgi:hypothetical protein